MDFEGFGEDPRSSRLEPLNERLLARTLRDIDERSREDNEVLLSALLCASWPTPWAQIG